ncbi:unnamed protein product [Laminaria digitata]
MFSVSVGSSLFFMTLDDGRSRYIIRQLSTSRNSFVSSVCLLCGPNPMRLPHLVSTAVRLGALLGCRTTNRVQPYLAVGGGGTDCTANNGGGATMTKMIARTSNDVGTSASPALRTFVDGNASGPVLVFVHGWPDDHTMWDKQVAHLKDRCLCITTDLPGFNAEDTNAERWGCSVDEVVKRLERTVEAAGNGQPVTLVAHDWGCIYSFMLEKKRPDLVRRMVAIDIGGVLKVPPLALFIIALYHSWLIISFLLGGPIGDAMSRAFAWLVGAPLRARVARASVGYPYYHWWKRKFSKDEENVPPMMPKVPLLFLYGTAGAKKFLVS